MNIAFTRILAAAGAASLLAACSSGAGTSATPATNGSLAPQSVSQVAPASAARATLEKKGDDKNKSALTATPPSLHFAAGDAAKTVTVSGAEGTFDVTIAGTGNCPTVSPSKLVVKGGGDDERDNDRGHGHDGRHDTHGPSAATITVTPAGAGPAACTITVSKHGDGDNEHGDNHDNDGDHGSASLTIPVTVDGPAATPTPVPTPVPTCGARGC